MFQQLQFIFGSLFSVPIFPILYWQSRKVKAKIPKLPDASQLFGHISEKVSERGNALKILFIGDSAVSGVGVETNQEGLAGNVSRVIASKTKRAIDWQVVAKSGFTAKVAIKKLLPKVPDKEQDAIIIGLGANEIFQMNSPLKGKYYLTQFLRKLRQKQPNSPILLINLPPFGELPNFPKLLSFYLDNLTRLHAEIINSVPAKFENVFYLSRRVIFSEWMDKFPADISKAAFFAKDGVHPSALTYSVWGKEIGKEVLRRKLLKNP